MKSNTLKENLIYQSLYQIIRVLTPLITIPLISRAFGPSGVGIYSFSFNMMQYFLMFANVGVQLYFNRLIADADSSKEGLSQRFWNIFVGKGLLCLLILIIYITAISVFVHEYYLIFLLQGIYIIGAASDISWFYAGIERFKLPSLSNIVTSVIVLLVVIFFVNDKSDLMLYAFTLAIITVVNQIPLFVALKGNLIKTSIEWEEVWRITKESMAYLLPNGQLNILTSIACVVIGLMSSYKEVGIFSNTINILIVAIVLINTIDLVMIPRITKQLKDKNYCLSQAIEKSLNVQIMLTIPMVLGLVVVMPGFYWWFFGEEFEDTVSLMSLLSILLFITPLNMLISRQYVLIKRHMYSYNLSIIIGIVINLLLCIILIPIFGIYGAAIARIFTELFILVWRFIDISRENIKISNLNLIKCIISAVIMFFSLVILNQFLPQKVYTTAIIIIVGIVIYISMNFMLKNYYFLLIIKSLINRGDKIDRYS